MSRLETFNDRCQELLDAPRCVRVLQLPGDWRERGSPLGDIVTAFDQVTESVTCQPISFDTIPGCPDLVEELHGDLLKKIYTPANRLEGIQDLIDAIDGMTKRITHFPFAFAIAFIQ